MRNGIRGVLNRFGVDLVRVSKPDPGLHLYASYPHESIADKRFYNIGAGAFHHPFWTNIDYGTEHYSTAQAHPFVNYNLEALVPLPIEDESAELFYSSHTIEHVSDGAVVHILKECHRTLKAGGGIRVTAPDALLAVRAWKRNDRQFWYWLEGHSTPGVWESLYTIPPSQASTHQLLLDSIATPLSEISLDPTHPNKIGDAELERLFSTGSDAEALDSLCKQCAFNPRFPGSHINWWSHDKLIGLLEQAGFSDCHASGYGQSAFPPLRDTSHFDSTNPKMSLYVEATK